MNLIYLYSKKEIRDIIYKNSFGKYKNNIYSIKFGEDNPKFNKTRINKIKVERKKRYFKAKYKIDENSDILIFGEEFVQINKNKYNIILNNKKSKLKSKINKETIITMKNE